MGIKGSEHIGKILIDPRNSEVIFVAAEGPLWNGGGDRGVYQSTDGGESWKQVLAIDENTGVTDLEFDPSNPDVIYAAAYQRRRKTWSLLSGGPESGIYKSNDNGGNWRKLTTGLPKGDIGKIGLAVTPADPNRVYATIEASDAEKGLYRSMNKGESWQKGSSYISGGTGPHYYQEIEASPVNPDLVYQMDVFLHVSRDAGRTFDYLETGRAKHSDNHALWIDPNDGQHLIAGTDGGLYESFDEGIHWRHFPNLPIAQFYKLDLDNSEPFYNILGGAQDLGTLLGPARTLHTEGVRNQDWYVPLGADGYHSLFDPEDPNIAYMEYQEGVLFRVDRRTNETMGIQPQPAPNDPPERWNWDSPLLISPHDHQTLYAGSQRVWKSENRGDSWTPISEDLTTNTNRYELETLDRVWSIDALYDNGAMSKYATLTGITESPLEAGVLYTGSDDGLVHVSEDGGANWRKAADLPTVPARSFINDLEASLHDANTAFVVADAHKLGDYRPLIFQTSNRGKSWTSIAGDLPDGTIVWAIKQDHEQADLLFIGTEYGLYVSPNGGTTWMPLKAGVPTISFRDLALHRRDNDLVGASFGRGFYVLDDYSSLRSLSAAVEAESSTLFPVRDAWWYVPNAPMQAAGMPSQGSDSYRGENPPFGAIFTYYLPEVPTTAKSERQKTEKDLRKAGKDVPFAGWERLREESIEGKPQALLLVSDAAGNPVRWIQGKASKGLHRASWDLKLPAPDPIRLSKPAFQPPWAGDPEGPLAAPGTYSVQLYVEHNGEMSAQGEVQSFEVKPIPSIGTGTDFEQIAEFQQQTRELSRQLASAGRKLSEAGERLRFLQAALQQTPKANAEHFASFHKLKTDLARLQTTLYGDPIRRAKEEPALPGISGRLGQATYAWQTTQRPTETQLAQFELASNAFETFLRDHSTYLEALAAFEQTLEEAGAPYTRGRRE
ncbi:MAG: glycosyl hydrolase [Bacteroidota bacterium]